MGYKNNFMGEKGWGPWGGDVGGWGEKFPKLIWKDIKDKGL